MIEFVLEHYPFSTPAAHSVLFDGRVRYSALSSPLAWGLKVVIRDVHGPHRATLRQGFWRRTPRCRLVFDDGARWTLVDAPTVTADAARFVAGDGSDAWLLQRVGLRIGFFRAARQFAEAVMTANQLQRTVWRVRAESDTDPWRLACALVALTATGDYTPVVPYVRVDVDNDEAEWTPGTHRAPRGHDG